MNMAMDINFQFQNTKLQLNNIQTQMLNIDNQIQNMGLMSTGSQIKNLGIQMLNTGIQLLNIGIQIPSMDMNEIFIIQQIGNIKMEIQNIEMKYTNMNMQVNNAPFQMQNMGMNFFNNNNLDNKFEEKYNKEVNNQKINILFSDSRGHKKFIAYNFGTTINDVLEIFLRKIGKPELINNIEGKINFISNGKTLKFGDKTKIEDFTNGIIGNHILIIDNFNYYFNWE